MSLVATSPDTIDLTGLKDYQKEIVVAVQNGGDLHQGIKFQNGKTYRLKNPDNEDLCQAKIVSDLSIWKMPPLKALKTFFSHYILYTSTRRCIEGNVREIELFSAIKHYKVQNLENSPIEEQKNARRIAALLLVDNFHSLNTRKKGAFQITLDPPRHVRYFHHDRLDSSARIFDQDGVECNQATELKSFSS